MDLQQRIFVVVSKMKGLNNKELREQFQRRYENPGPKDKSIREIVSKFMRTGSVHDERRTEEAIDNVEEAFNEDPRLSTRSAAHHLG